MGVDIEFFIETNNDEESSKIVENLQDGNENIFFKIEKYIPVRSSSVDGIHGVSIYSFTRYIDINSQDNYRNRIPYALMTIKAVVDAAEDAVVYYGSDLRDSPVYADTNEEFYKLLEDYELIDDSFLEKVAILDEMYPAE